MLCSSAAVSWRCLRTQPFGTRSLATKLARSFQERYSVHFGADDWATLGVPADVSRRRSFGLASISKPQCYYLRVLLHHLAPPEDHDLPHGELFLKRVCFARAKEDLPMKNVGNLPIMKGEMLEVLDDTDPATWFGRSLRLESGTVEAKKLEHVEEAFDSREQSRQAMYLNERVLLDPKFTQAIAAPLVLDSDTRVVELEEYLEETFSRAEKGRLVVSVSFLADGYEISGSRRIGDVFFGKAVSLIVWLAQSSEPDLSFQYRVEGLDINDGQKLYEYPAAVRSKFNPLNWFRRSSRST